MCRIDASTIILNCAMHAKYKVICIRLVLDLSLSDIPNYFCLSHKTYSQHKPKRIIYTLASVIIPADKSVQQSVSLIAKR